ncbi:endonuclease/exonuclease/phosphatase family protein [Desulfatiferula olefinivorans]
MRGRVVGPWTWIILSIVFFQAGHGYADEAATLRIASYNVENLFDSERQGTEYPEYVPDGASGWNETMARIKYRQIARVLSDLDADIAALQEVESDLALDGLQDALAEHNRRYAFRVFSKTPGQAVGCALLSRFPVRSQHEMQVAGGRKRGILKVELMVRGRLLIVYVNHWKSKNAPESARMQSASALAAETSALPPETDYVIVGDLNADYDEYRTFATHKKLNDTLGKTGINHVLKTLVDGRLTTREDLIRPGCESCLYNLWLELPPSTRWSHNFFGRKGSMDHILVPKALFDKRGIDYRVRTFNRFMPDYLFQNNRLDRWRMSRRGRGRHLGGGYSDHLPVYADFTVR